MEGQNYLGIYLSKGSATVVCLDSQGREGNVLGCFTISVEKPEQANPQALARLIAQACAERELTFSDVAVALDSTLFMQHSVHSEFADAKQIAATVRFDTEETLSTDISDAAVAFEIAGSGDNGSELTVFTAERKILSEILLALQSNNIDPITVEPDVKCLSRYVSRNVSLTEDSQCLFGILSQRSGYFLAFAKSRQAPAVRTFLIAPKQDRTDLLAREVPLTIALVAGGEPVGCLKVFDSSSSVNHQQLAERLGIEVSGIDLIESAGVGSDVLGDGTGCVDFAIAYGAALAHFDKVPSTNFRNDFMPYQGKKLRIQRTLKVMSISVSVLMVALGMYVTAQLWSTNKGRGELRNKFKPDYLAVMGGRPMPSRSTDVVGKLGRELNRTRALKKGIVSKGGEQSVSAKLALVLGAFNRCAAPTRLRIERINITAKHIRIDGSTSSRKNTRKLFQTIRENLVIIREDYSLKGGRDNFHVTVAPKSS